MKCNKCSSSLTRVTSTDHKDRYTVRYCRCLDCKNKFKTIERYSKKVDRARTPTNAKLDPIKVKMIRDNEENFTYEEWADAFDVETSTIYNVKSYKTWKYVPKQHALRTRNN